MAVSNAHLPVRARSTRYLPVVLAWQVAIVAAALLVTVMQVWALILAGLVVLGMLLLSVPVNGRTLLSTLAIRSRFNRRRREFVADPATIDALLPLAQWAPRLAITQTKSVRGGEIGVVADDDAWVGILSLASDDALIVDRGAGIDLSTLGELTRQDDVVFAAIQVLTMTVPGPTEAMLAPGSLATGSYLELTGAEEPTPPAVRRTWLALRLDPRLCMEAVDRRGSGQAGVMATLRFGLHRAQAQLKRQGVAAHPLDAAGVADVLALTTSAWTGQDDEVSSESWEQWRSGSLVHETRGIRSFGKEPGQNYQKLLDSLSQAPSMMVLTSFTVSPGEPPRGAVRQIMPTQELADAADEELIGEAGDIVSFGPLGGVQIPGLLATIPLGRRVG